MVAWMRVGAETRQRRGKVKNRLRESAGFHDMGGKVEGRIKVSF